MANPQLCAAMMGILIRGLGADHVCWGTDAIWTGSPQWQIEALRRLEIPEDMQKQYGFQPLGAADGPVKTAILGGNNARLYKYPVSRKPNWPQTASPSSGRSTSRMARTAATAPTATSDAGWPRSTLA